MTDILLRHDHQHIATLTLNRPAARNALSMGLMEALAAALSAIEHDPAVRVVIIAAILTLGAIYLMLTPENFGAELTKAVKTVDSVPQARKQPGEAPALIFKDKKK